jgi:hypothetical protein
MYIVVVLKALRPFKYKNLGRLLHLPRALVLYGMITIPKTIGPVIPGMISQKLPIRCLVIG